MTCLYQHCDSSASPSHGLLSLLVDPPGPLYRSAGYPTSNPDENHWKSTSLSITFQPSSHAFSCIFSFQSGFQHLFLKVRRPEGSEGAKTSATNGTWCTQLPPAQLLEFFPSVATMDVKDKKTSTQIFLVAGMMFYSRVTRTSSAYCKLTLALSLRQKLAAHNEWSCRNTSQWFRFNLQIAQIGTKLDCMASSCTCARAQAK